MTFHLRLAYRSVFNRKLMYYSSNDSKEKYDFALSKKDLTVYENGSLFVITNGFSYLKIRDEKFCLRKSLTNSLVSDRDGAAIVWVENDKREKKWVERCFDVDYMSYPFCVIDKKANGLRFTTDVEIFYENSELKDYAVALLSFFWMSSEYDRKNFS